MLEISPTSNFLAKRSSWVLVSLNGGQRITESGRKPDREGFERPAELARDVDRGAAQDLGVELVRSTLDLLLGLDEERDQLLARQRVPVALGLLGEGVEGAVSQSIRVP